jgi:HK97 gp10 family phage protein
MAERFRFDDEGLRDLFDSRDGPIAKDLLRRTLRVESGAKRLCPVDTGRLRSSITHAVEQDEQGLVGRIGTDVDYAPFVELGTSRAPAQPFLRPALGSEVSR